MRINNNISAMNAWRGLTQTDSAMSKSLEKLSSGYRINRAGDDAAGLAISEKMRSQIRGLNQASSNAQDGISLIQTAEGALSETHSILQRMRELAVQSANGTSTDDDRGEIQKEVDQLTGEINRIGTDTEFNNKKILDGGVGVQLNSNATTIDAVETTSDTKSGVYAVTISAVATQATLANATGDGTATAIGNFGSDTGLNAGNDGKLTAGGTLTLNGTNINLATNDTIDKVVQKINNYSEVTGVKAIVQQGSANTYQKIILQSTEFGSDATISAQFSTTALSNELGFGGNVSVSAAGTNVAGTIGGTAGVGDGTELTLVSAGADADGLTVDSKVQETAASITITQGTGTIVAAPLIINGATLTHDATATVADLVAEINSKSDKLGVTAKAISGTSFSLTSTAVGVNAKITLSGAGFTQSTETTLKTADADGIVTGDDGASTADVANITVSKDSVVKMQIGANANQTMDIDIGDMRASALGVDNINVATAAGAQSAIDIIDDAVVKVSSERAKLGAFQNRLEHTINNLGTSSENLTASESRIRDVDMAQEMMNYTKLNILSQAGTAMLAQANQRPQSVLQLLQ